MQGGAQGSVLCSGNCLPRPWPTASPGPGPGREGPPRAVCLQPGGREPGQTEPVAGRASTSSGREGKGHSRTPGCCGWGPGVPRGGVGHSLCPQKPDSFSISRAGAGRGVGRPVRVPSGSWAIGRRGARQLGVGGGDTQDSSYPLLPCWHQARLVTGTKQDTTMFDQDSRSGQSGPGGQARRRGALPSLCVPECPLPAQKPSHLSPLHTLPSPAPHWDAFP